MVIAHPVRVVAVQPHPLEAHGQAASRRADHEVAAELHVGGLEFGVRLAARGAQLDALPGVERALLGGRLAEREAERAERRAVVGDMGAQQGVGRVLSGGTDLVAGELLRVGLGVAVAVGGVRRVVGAAADDDGQVLAAGEGDVRAADGDPAAAAVGGDGGSVLQAVGERGAEGGRGGLAVRALQCDRAGVASAAVLAEVEDDRVVGAAGEDLPLVRHSRADVGGSHHAPLEVEGAAVAGDGAEVVVGDVDGELGEQGQGPEVRAAVGELAVGVERVVEAAGPHRGVGDEEDLVARVVAREGAEAAVADGEALFDHRGVAGGRLPPQGVV